MKSSFYTCPLVVCMFVFLVGTSDLARAQAPPTKGKGKREFPSIADVTKDYSVQKGGEEGGLMTLFIEKKKHRILAAIPISLQGAKFLLATSITGGQYTGWQWDDLMVYWERHDRKLVLVEPEIRYRSGGGTIAEVVKRTYRDRVVTAVPILAEGRGGTVLIDLTALFAGRASLFVGSLASGVDASLAKIANAKVFPENVEIAFDLPRTKGRGFSRSGGRSSGGIAVHYSISRLDRKISSGYQPRLADDRIGYFLTAHKDFSKNPNEHTTFVRYVNRWNVQKLDPSLKLSQPKNPIIFYVEKTVPARYRQYVYEGILEWNKAFEKIGILNAIQVQQQGVTPGSEKFDPEDVRYNFFRWITSSHSFAMGPSRVHPETGQILDADIIFDDSMIRDWLAEYSQLIIQGPAKEFHPGLRLYLDDNPERHPMRRWMRRSRSLGQAGSREPEGESPENQEGEHARVADEPRLKTFCDYGHGKHHQVSFGLTVLRTLFSDELERQAKSKGKDGDEWPEEFIGQVLKEVVMHEVGHTLGLRHNFKGSSWLSLEEINDSETPRVAVSGSVMDYNPTNIRPAGKSQGLWTTTTLGPYDYWAIEYGYTLKNDKKQLAKIASRAAEKGLAYGTDEDTFGSDPYVYRFDMGNDPLAYARERMTLVEQTLRDLVGKTVNAGDGYQRVRQAFDMLLFEYARSSWLSARFLGGHHIRRDHKGDPNERTPVEPIGAAKQREALDLVCESIFKRNAFSFSPELLNHLAAGRWHHWGSNDIWADAEYPIHDRILQVQLWSLFDCLNPRTLALISDAELRVSDDTDAITLPELFEKLTDAIWTEVRSKPASSATEKYTNRKPFIDSVRRNLQHEYVHELVDIALEGKNGSSPQSARTQAWYRLQKLGNQIGSALESDGDKLDDYSRAHLEESRQRIAKALEASFSRNGGGGGQGGFMLLLGHPGENTPQNR